MEVVVTVRGVVTPQLRQRCHPRPLGGEGSLHLGQVGGHGENDRI
jgi:hypothetical protein